MLQRNWRCTCGFAAPVPVRMLGELATCPKCAAKTTLDMKNTHPIVVRETEAGVAANSAAQETCSRCGRVFRGDWNRHARGEGMICNICARQVGNQATGSSQAPLQAEAGPPRASNADVVLPENWHDMHDALRDAARSDDPPRIWRGHVKIVFSILGTVALVAGALTYLLNVAPQSVDAYEAGDLSSLAVLLAERFVSGVLVTFVSLYVTCWYLERLPNEVLWANVLALGLVSLWLGVIGMLGVNGYMVAMSMVISVLMVRYLYDFSLHEFLFYSLIFSACSSALLIITGLADLLFTKA